jgi:lipocalin-like protein
MHEHRNEADGHPSPHEVQAEFSAYFGTYIVDWTRTVVSHHVVGSLSAERASAELRRDDTFRNGALVLTFTRAQNGALNTLVWKRVSQSRS